ncbi:hypothetical protein M0R89_18575 (plasmid) [Halorussus limi]|uniref:CARDB domain-containing protein n=1 Tax=Halorussus limi TaxID=2938695 RepID=A0A8U0I066_9EURY|nr:hypothetical protein [Halorussus limi]UPV76539.1 hypothetical protein M0R89_18575 [Halorussus limi]
MKVAKSGRSRVVLCVLGLIVASGSAGAVAALPATTADGATVGAASDDAAGERGAALAQAEDNASGNDSRRSILIPSAAVTVGDTTVGVEEVLLTVRQGTGSVFVKTLTTQNPEQDASVTNLRVAVGERFLQRLGSGAPGFGGAQYTVSFGRFAAGQFDYRLGTAIIRGFVGAAPPAAGGTDEPTDRGLDRSSFVVTNFSAPERVPLGEGYTVSARVTNPGQQNGTEIVRYEFGDVTLGRQVVQLAPNASTNVTFQVAPVPLPDSTGTYTHSVQAFDSNATAQIRLVAGNESAGNGSAADSTRPPVGA